MKHYLLSIVFIDTCVLLGLNNFKLYKWQATLSPGGHMSLKTGGIFPRAPHPCGSKEDHTIEYGWIDKNTPSTTTIRRIHSILFYFNYSVQMKTRSVHIVLQLLQLFTGCRNRNHPAEFQELAGSWVQDKDSCPLSGPQEKKLTIVVTIFFGISVFRVFFFIILQLSMCECVAVTLLNYNVTQSWKSSAAVFASIVDSTQCIWQSLSLFGKSSD